MTLRALTEIEQALLAPGANFETATESVGGHDMEVFTRRAQNLREVLANSAAFGDAELYIFDDGRRVTFNVHLDDVASVAAALGDMHGVGQGDRVAILGENSYEWIVTFWATISLGAIAVGLNGWWEDAEIRRGISLTTPTLLVADRKRLARLGSDGAGIDTVVIEDGFDALLAHDRTAALSTVAIDEDDPALILFTSGTTGSPKGAINTHRNVIAYLGVAFFAAARAARTNPPPPDAPPTLAIMSSPLFHVSGLHAGAISRVASGTKVIWTTGRFDPVKILEITQAERVTRWGGVTTQIWRLLTHPAFDDYDHSTVRSIGGGGSTWSPEFQRLIRERLPNAAGDLSVGYGLTECSALATMATTEMLLADPTCVGEALPTVALAILDPDGGPLPDGEIGEVCVRGPMVMPGYWNDPEATANAITADGWLRTGDYGRLDKGLLFIASRLRDLIIRGGENVHPIEIENRLEEHPDIREAAVIGVDHVEYGQEVKAVVVPMPGATLSVTQVQGWVAQTLAYYKVPAHVEIRTEELPRNATGKVLKLELR